MRSNMHASLQMIFDNEYILNMDVIMCKCGWTITIHTSKFRWFGEIFLPKVPVHFVVMSSGVPIVHPGSCLGSCFTSSTRSWSPPQKLLTSPSDKNFGSTSSSKVPRLRKIQSFVGIPTGYTVNKDSEHDLCLAQLVWIWALRIEITYQWARQLNRLNIIPIQEIRNHRHLYTRRPEGNSTKVAVDIAILTANCSGFLGCWMNQVTSWPWELKMFESWSWQTNSEYA